VILQKPDRGGQLPKLRISVCLAVVAVFLFAFHAKISGYGHEPSSRVSPSTSAKLWLNGQKSEVEPQVQSVGVLAWIAFLLVNFEALWRTSLVRPVTSVARRRPLQELRRFLRPPPLF